MSLHDLGVFLDNPITLLCLCAIGGGLAFGIVAWAFTGEYEKGGYEPVHVRPKTPEPWDREPDSGEFSVIAARVDTKEPARHRADTMGGETTRLDAYTRTARARVVLIGPEGLSRDEEASGAYRAGSAQYLRRATPEGDVEEEERPDRERGELPREAVEDGEEGGEDETVPPLAGQARWFRNTVTGEYVFVDEFGRRIDFEAGA